VTCVIDTVARAQTVTQITKRRRRWALRVLCNSHVTENGNRWLVYVKFVLEVSFSRYIIEDAPAALVSPDRTEHNGITRW